MSLLKEKKNPKPPKQPVTGYVHFLNSERKALMIELPDDSLNEISKKLYHKWSQLSNDMKKKYFEQEDLDKERYSREIEKYQQTLMRYTVKFD